MANQDYQPGDTVELKDKETGFFDDETDFKIVRDQKVKLGDSIGRKTNAALMSGGLLVVAGGNGKPAKENNKEKTQTSDFPEDFPGKDAFIQAGLTFDQVKALKTEEETLAVSGIDAKTVEAMKAWAEKNKPKA